MLKIASHIIFLSFASSSVLAQLEVIPSGTTTNILDIKGVNDTIFISGQNNYFAKIQNGGSVPVSLNFAAPNNYNNIDFEVVDSNFYMLSLSGSPAFNSQIYKSDDFGQNWNLLYDTSSVTYYTLSIGDSTWGNVAGLNGEMAKLQLDYTWQPGIIDNSIMHHAMESSIIGDSTVVLITSSSNCMVSEDRGQSWNQYTGYTSGKHKDIQVFNKDTLFSAVIKGLGAGPYEAAFARSFDGGHTWEAWGAVIQGGENDFPFVSSEAFSIHFTDDLHGYLVGKINSKRIDFFTTIPINKGAIFETFDGGITWSGYISEYDDGFLTQYHVNDNLAYIGGENGLLLKWDKTIPLYDNLSLVKIEKISLLDQFIIQPNPASHEIQIISTNCFGDYEIKLYDLIGSTVYRSTSNNYSLILDVSSFPEGCYFIELICSNQHFVKKFIIKK